MAHCLKKDANETISCFDFSFAPEIEAGQAHGTPVDVWGLGQVTQFLLNHLSKNNTASENRYAPALANLLTQLAASMVQENPLARPTMA